MSSNQTKEQLIVENINFATSIAKKYFKEKLREGLSYEEVEAAAFLGLCDAAKRYDADCGTSFRTFSYFRIRGAIIDMQRKEGGISRSYFNDLVADRSEDEEDRQRLPYTMATSISDLNSLSSIIEQTGVSVYLRSNENAQLSYLDHQTPEDLAHEQASEKYIQSLISRLPEKEQLVIKHRYYNDLSFSEMGKEIGDVSKSWCCRAHTKALRGLRSMVNADNYGCKFRVEESLAA